MLKMTFAIGCSFYNDLRGLERLVDSVSGNLEYLIFLDGRYVYNDNRDYAPEPLSTDGSREYIQRVQQENRGGGMGTLLLDVPDVSESQKRQKYLDITKELGIDCLIVLDSDEYVFCADWIKFRYDCYKKIVVADKCQWNIWNLHFREPTARPRLFWKPWEVAYGPTHYYVYLVNDKNSTPVNMGGDNIHTIDHVVISHRHDLRSAQHQFSREYWEKKQQAVEDARFEELKKELITKRQQT